MRRWLFILCLFAGLHAAGAASAYPFRSGESASYALYYKMGVNTEVGTFQLKLDSVQFAGQKAYHIDFKGQSAPFFDLFFKIREEFHSWVRVSDLRPISFTRDTYEGGYIAKNTYTYDWDAGIIRADITKGKNPRKKISIPLKENLYDLPALLYHLRAQDYTRMKAGKTSRCQMAIDDKVYTVVMVFKGKESLKMHRGGKRMAYHISCSLLKGDEVMEGAAGVFEGNEDLQFWLAADETLVPVAIKAPLHVGTAWVWLDQYKR